MSRGKRPVWKQKFCGQLRDFSMVFVNARGLDKVESEFIGFKSSRGCEVEMRGGVRVRGSRF